MGARDRCCCECITFTDDFERDDSTSLGNDWEECVGDWEIDDGELTVATAGAVVICKQKVVGHPVGIFEVTIHFNGGAKSPVGAKYQILAYYGTDGDGAEFCDEPHDPWILELEILTTSTGKMRLIDPDDNVIDDRDTVFSGNTTDLKLCIGDEDIVGSSESVNTDIAWCAEDLTGYWFALGSGAAVAVYYETANYSDQYDHNDECPDCTTPCCCPCLEGKGAATPPDKITATIYAPSCTTMHGVSTTLTCNRLPPGCCTWTSDDPLTFGCEEETDCGLVGGVAPVYTLGLSMACAGGTGTCADYQLTVSWPGGSENHAQCWDDYHDQLKTVVGECTCVPLLLTFTELKLVVNPSQLQDWCCACCEDFSIIMTD